MSDIKVILGGGQDEWILKEMFTVLKAGKDVLFLSTDMEYLTMMKTQFLSTKEFDKSKVNDEAWILPNGARMTFDQERGKGCSGHLIVAHNPTYEMCIEDIASLISKDDTRLIIDYTHPDVPDFIMKLSPPSL